MQVHGYLIVNGYELNCVNSLCNMYFHCGEVSCAEKVSEGLEEDAILILIKIRGYVFNQMYCDVLKYVTLTHGAKILEVDCTIFVPLFTACAKLSLLRVGRQVHGLLIALTYSIGNFYLLEEYGAIIGSTLIDMYFKCNSVGEARRVFDNWFPSPHVFHWNSVIAGCVYNGLVEEARALWEKMPERNVVSWTSMISGYVKNGMPQEGLNLLAKMHANQDKPRVDGNCLTFVSGLQACSYLTDFERGKQIHAKLIRMLGNADTSNVIVGTALVDMYSKSSNLNYARTVFDRMLEKNVAAWTSIITGYAVHGLGSHALEIFHQMMGMGIQPNEVTFVSILTACSHSGLVEEGLHCFMLMRLKYNAVLQEDHYTCLIDMLGRVGRLEEAWSLVEELEDGMTYSETVFGAMLGACHLHENMELGRRVALKMLEKKMQVSTTYVTLSNVYAALGMWNEAYAVRRNFRIEVDVGRKPGLSRICM
ncbi:pentatricopeptide repeat-containing protein At2g13600-like isoform X2 [Malania oleifera]|uniref:pentatricopeptide repeat-containing protein At2g13600-like isoform X2 n=1 Tax=Malania oleifera TaxID=397392 RepID=UPI0025AE3E27|nr:pentatricopeptide repeat-containing protein At2g13600-like isoform X2 [Malania oleifera]